MGLGLERSNAVVLEVPPDSSMGTAGEFVHSEQVRHGNLATPSEPVEAQTWRRTAERASTLETGGGPPRWLGGQR